MDGFGWKDDDDDDDDKSIKSITELPATARSVSIGWTGTFPGYVTTSCGHHFHSECMSGVSGSVCPVCRFALDATAKKRGEV